MRPAYSCNASTYLLIETSVDQRIIFMSIYPGPYYPTHQRLAQPTDLLKSRFSSYQLSSLLSLRSSARPSAGPTYLSRHLSNDRSSYAWNPYLATFPPTCRSLMVIRTPCAPRLPQVKHKEIRGLAWLGHCVAATCLVVMQVVQGPRLKSQPWIVPGRSLFQSRFGKTLGPAALSGLLLWTFSCEERPPNISRGFLQLLSAPCIMGCWLFGCLKWPSVSWRTWRPLGNLALEMAAAPDNLCTSTRQNRTTDWSISLFSQLRPASRFGVLDGGRSAYSPANSTINCRWFVLQNWCLVQGWIFDFCGKWEPPRCCFLF